MIFLKAGVFFLILLNAFCANALDCDQNKQATLPLKFDSVDMLYGDLAPVIKNAVLEVVKEHKLFEKKDADKKTYVVANLNNGDTPVVFGLTEKQVLEMDDDVNGSACGANHNHDDMSNRWCHAFFVKLVYETARKNGIPNVVSAVMGASIFVVKEYAIDLHPSKADMVIADYEVFRSKDNSSVINGTIFADKMFFITYKKRF